jgi:ribokinase
VPKRPQTFVIGDINRDLFLHLHSFPKPGRDNPAGASAWALGGSAFNTAAALVRLKVPTGVIGRVGNDSEGQTILKEMVKMGIHTRFIQKDREAPTGICVIPVTPDGERTLIGARGANRNLEAEGIQDSIQGIRHLHISGYTLVEPKSRQAVCEALRAARQLGVRTSIDFTWHAAVSAPEAIREVLPLVDVALPSASELRVAFGVRQLSRAADTVLELGVEHIAATLGAGGCRVYGYGRPTRVPPFEVRVVNTCGAGDAFNAGYILGILGGANPVSCAVLGNAAGAAAVASEHPYRSLDRARLVEILRDGMAHVRGMKLREAMIESIELLSRSTTRSRRRRS